MILSLCLSLRGNNSPISCENVTFMNWQFCIWWELYENIPFLEESEHEDPPLTPTLNVTVSVRQADCMKTYKWDCTNYRLITNCSEIVLIITCSVSKLTFHFGWHPFQSCIRQLTILFHIDFNISANRTDHHDGCSISLESVVNSQWKFLSVCLVCVLDSSKCEEQDNDKRAWGETWREDLGVTGREVREESVNGRVQLQCVWGKGLDR